MKISSYTIPPSSDYPFFMTAKRYWISDDDDDNADDNDARTLVLLHSTSFLKEIWGPFMEELHNLFVTTTNRGGKDYLSSSPSSKKLGVAHAVTSVRDAWAIECPNHGESAYLNLRLSQKLQKFSCQKYAQVVHRFLTLHSTRNHSRKRKLIGIGHSLGANALLLLQSIQPTIEFSQLIIIEPMLSANGLSQLLPLRDELVNRARQRKDTWPTRDVLRQSLIKRKWDLRVIEAFVNHGIYWDPNINALTLCCSREEEIAMYLDIEGPTKPVAVLNEIGCNIPIHIILGEYSDLIPKHVHEALVDHNSGRRFASIIKMKNVGHLIPQQRPTELASCVFHILSSGTSHSTNSSRL